MKKTAATIILLAGFGGGCVSPNGTGTAKPFNTAYRSKDTSGATTGVAKTTTTKSDLVQASATMPAGTYDPNVQQAAGFARAGGNWGGGGCDTGCNDCGDSHRGLFHRQWGGHRAMGGVGYGAGYGGGMMMHGGMGGPGYGMPGMGSGAMYANQKTAIKFLNPQGMQVSWMTGGGYPEPGLTTPVSYNFAQGNVYRLRVKGIPNRPGKIYYPSLEVWHATPTSITFLSHNTVPIGFTDEDFDQVNAGNMVVKVIYLPDPAYQELSTVAGAEELVSTKLQPGENPIAEAQRRGTILAIIRLGNIDLENPNSPAINAPAMMAPPAAPAMFPGGGVPAAMPVAPAKSAAAPATSGSTGVTIPSVPATTSTAPRTNLR